MNLGLPLDCVATEPSTICDAIRVHAALDPQRPAIVCADLPALTFGELDRTILDYEPSTWRRLARAVHDKQVPGVHNTCVTTFAGVAANEPQGIFAGRNSGRRMR